MLVPKSSGPKNFVLKRIANCFRSALRFASMQVCKFASMQVCKYASMQVCKYKSIKVQQAGAELCQAQTSLS